MRLVTSSSHVVRLCDVGEERGCVFLLLEYCSVGNMQQILMAQAGFKLSERRAARWARHLLTGLRDLHALDIIHRDIKFDNLLITAAGALKITDFGWCSTKADAPTTLAGTFTFMAPEVLR